MRYSGIKRPLTVAFFLASVISWGCAMTKRPMHPLASVEGFPGHFRTGRIVHVDTGKALSFDRFIEQLQTKDLIFIGEKHDNPEHHLIQVQILQALMARYGDLTAAMEIFQETQQSALDEYIKGNTPETDFLKDVDWRKTWGYDYNLYRPLLLMLREKGYRTLAINAPNDIVKKVARSGLASLKTGERDQLARDIDLKNENHREYLREVFEEHTLKDINDFEYFYQAQCVWEDTMAENLAEYLKVSEKRVVVFVGNGHIVNKYGIPDRILKHIPVSLTTVVLYPLTGKTTITKEAADYVWLTGDCSHRRLMRPPKHGIKVKQ